MDTIIQIKGNVCPICYSTELYWSPNFRKSQVEIFVCKHFTCKSCYQKLNIDEFKCPICRCEGSIYKDTFASIEIKKWNTLEDWYYHWEKYMTINQAGLKKSKFGKIYFDLIEDAKTYIKKRKEEKKKYILEKRKDELIKRKKIEKENSICKLCQTKCTSLIQLKKHVNSKNCLKKQRIKSNRL